MGDALQVALASPVNFIGTLILMVWAAVCVAAAISKLGPFVLVMQPEKEK